MTEPIDMPQKPKPFKVNHWSIYLYSIVICNFTVHRAITGDWAGVIFGFFAAALLYSHIKTRKLIKEVKDQQEEIRTKMDRVISFKNGLKPEEPKFWSDRPDEECYQPHFTDRSITSYLNDRQKLKDAEYERENPKDN